MLFRFLVVLLAFAIASAQIIANIEAGKNQDLGVYFPGDKDANHDVFRINQKENLLTTVAKTKNKREAVKFGTSLVIRTADFKTRVRLDFAQSSEAGNPYVLAFYNLASGDRDGDDPLELQHSNSGFIWIDGGKRVAHNTDINHPFVVRDVDKKILFTITLQPNDDEL
jgi:hypothetical protein